jgi:phosphoglycolate phosphatase
MSNTTVNLSENNIESFLDSIDTFLLDCDGVLWRGKEVIPGVIETLEYLRKIGKHLIFVTNNSTKSREDYKKTIEGYGIAVKKEEIFSSSFATAAYLDSIKFDKKAYIIGGSGIGQELTEVGISWRGIDEHTKIQDNVQEILKSEIDPEIGAIITGLDPHLTYWKLSYAFMAFQQNKNCLFIATNTDSTYPVSEGVILPGGGVMVEAFATATGKRPDFVCGKPEQSFLDLIVQRCKLNRSRTCMVGDRLETDILFGNKGQLKSLLVMTGIATKEQLEDESLNIKPQFLTSAFPDLLSFHSKAVSK